MDDDAPLAEALIAYLEKARRPFHMPGHKQGAGIPPVLARLWGREIFRYDLTELPGLDDLHAPREAIQRAQEASARCFGAERTWFLVNGSTVGIQAAIMAAAGEGDAVLVPRQAHRSVLGGLILSGARPVYRRVTLEPRFGIPLASRVEDVEDQLSEESRVRAVVEVHPNYYGVAGEISGLARLCSEKGIPLLVDEAHGAHFQFDPRLPGPALSQGADVSVQSWHKTLTALTQTAVLHLRGGRVDRERISRCLSVLQTTSPSYPLLLSLDAARQQMETGGEAVWSRVLELSEWTRHRVKRIPGLDCLGDEIMDAPAVGGWDPTKLLVGVTGLGLSGFEAAGWLREMRGIEPELADPRNVLFMLTPGDDRGSAEYLVESLESMAREHRPADGSGNWGGEGHERIFDLLPEVVLTPREAFNREHRAVPLKNAVGEVCAETISPYPPGVPLLAPGEVITREAVEVITELKSRGTAWQGWSDQGHDRVLCVV
ncbi:MAG: aminotransferase class I/II-fold pyridoxal phosphate-dependent enzyme [Firmicutes bacterium]|nr:aminotransferase class I/II-fold pyridoxal phosphate-dependent enzyme [Bacillota bacterium]